MVKIVPTVLSRSRLPDHLAPVAREQPDSGHYQQEDDDVRV
jgi:hypothetical protein